MRTYRTELKTIEEECVDTITCDRCYKVFDYDNMFSGIEVRITAMDGSHFGDCDEREMKYDLCDDCYSLTLKLWTKER